MAICGTPQVPVERPMQLTHDAGPNQGTVTLIPYADTAWGSASNTRATAGTSKQPANQAASLVTHASSLCLQPPQSHTHNENVGLHCADNVPHVKLRTPGATENGEGAHQQRICSSPACAAARAARAARSQEQQQHKNKDQNGCQPLHLTLLYMCSSSSSYLCAAIHCGGGGGQQPPLPPPPP